MQGAIKASYCRHRGQSLYGNIPKGPLLDRREQRDEELIRVAVKGLDKDGMVSSDFLVFLMALW
jgi:hypothetical protein